ncbi:hypothetical protein [Streptomyces sp. WM6386]|uniref:hypothetical protein n=1 Tax=Streptomyces sp. WM6386 TaxID=1415558 RepID=UPI000619C9B6|nr:hypothetical protein [Streptomyces sp. WM6386]
MDQGEDQILADALAALGGRLTGFVAKLMRKNVDEIDLVVPLPFGDAVERVVAVLGEGGQPVVPMRVGDDRDQEMMRVVVGGGLGGLNPVVVTVRVTRGTEDSSAVRLRAAAKEGLVKQRAGEKTAARLAALLPGPDGEFGTPHQK